MVLFIREFNQNHKIFKCELVPTRCSRSCVLVLTTLKMTIRVAVAYRWLLSNNITFIPSTAFVGLFKKLLYTL